MLAWVSLPLKNPNSLSSRNQLVFGNATGLQPDKHDPVECVQAHHGGAHKEEHPGLPRRSCELRIGCKQSQSQERKTESNIASHWPEYNEEGLGRAWSGSLLISAHTSARAARLLHPPPRRLRLLLPPQPPHQQQVAAALAGRAEGHA